MDNLIEGFGVAGLERLEGISNERRGVWDRPGELFGGASVELTLEFLRMTSGGVSGRSIGGAGEAARCPRVRGPRGRDCMMVARWSSTTLSVASLICLMLVIM